jgi:ubiquinone biosynthesis protein UbiJ
LVRTGLVGDKPSVQIEGDVQLAAEVNWLVDHVRWDVEDDLARLVGDVPAHAIGSAVQKLAAALRRLVNGVAGGTADGSANRSSSNDAGTPPGQP